MSVQALSGDELNRAGITRLYELQFAVPGLVVNTVGMFGAGFSLRGIADQLVAGLAVAPYLDGVYLGNANLALARMFDLERVEVLKGPQGTLYGRNSTAGSINFITRSPQDVFSAEVEGSYGSFETTRVQGHVNVPLQENALRLAFIASEGDGYIRNSVDDRTFGEEDFWGVRAALRIHSTDNLSIDVMAQHIRDDGASAELWTPNPGYLVDRNDIRLTTVTLENPYLISEIDNVAINLSYDLKFATLRSITGYARSKIRNLDDCAGDWWMLGCVRSVAPSRHEQWSQELQLVFARTGSIEGLIGAYYADVNASANYYLLFPLLDPQLRTDSHDTTSESAAALFGQTTWHFRERWSATAGVRLSWEESRITSIGTGVQDSPTLLVGKDDWDDVSWRLDLQRAVTDDLMMYAGVSTGYKSGGFTEGITVGIPGTYGPEYLTAFEAGMKSQWLDRRLTLNAAAFLYDFEDMQVSWTGRVNGVPLTKVDNAASAELYGIDADADFHASERFSVSAAAVWLPKAEFVRYEGDGIPLTGNALVRSPEWTATTSMTYEFPFREFGALSASLEYAFRSDYFYTTENLAPYWQDSFGLLNLFFRFESADESWYAFASGRNLTSEDYFAQVFLQSSPGYPDTYEIGAGYRF